MAPLEGLRFDNTVLQELPVDESKQRGVRQVRGAVYSLVDPTPLREPRLVASCADALALLGLDAAEAARPEFAEVMAGNRVLTEQGSRPAAHCYCGYQFGFFAGQLGDGAGALHCIALLFTLCLYTQPSTLVRWSTLPPGCARSCSSRELA